MAVKILRADRLPEISRRMEVVLDLTDRAPVEAGPERKAIEDSAARSSSDAQGSSDPPGVVEPVSASRRASFEGPVDLGSWSQLYEAAHSLQASGNVDAAIAALEAAAELNPEHPAIAYDLGYALQQSGNDDQAIEHYRRAISLRPNHAFALHNLAFLLDRNGQEDEAAEFYRRALHLRPNDAYIAFNYANLLERRGQIDRAKDLYRRAAEVSEDALLEQDAEARLGRLMGSSS